MLRAGEFPVTLGRDFAGVVEDVGSAVSRYKSGDEVFGFVMHASPTVHDGSWADCVVVPEDVSVAAKPASLDLETAGAAPLTAVTAPPHFPKTATSYATWAPARSSTATPM